MDRDEIARARVKEAADLLSRGAIYSGFVRLGEVAKFLESTGKEYVRQAILEQARRAELSTIEKEMRSAVNRITRILSTGGIYDAHEIVLVLTLRIELESAEALLAELGYPLELVPVTLDNDIRALRTDKANRMAYETALAMVRRNWGFPITSEWLA